MILQIIQSPSKGKNVVVKVFCHRPKGHDELFQGKLLEPERTLAGQIALKLDKWDFTIGNVVGIWMKEGIETLKGGPATRENLFQPTSLKKKIL